MKILLLGKNGQLGSAFLKRLGDDVEVSAYDQSDFDLCDEGAMKRAFDEVGPDWVLNCAAYTNVDGCENNKDLAFKVNAEAPGMIAGLCEKSGAKLIHFSTDYVFDGENEIGYKEDDTMNPISVYGGSKAEGEVKVKNAMNDYYIIRPSFLYGDGMNFIKTMLNAADGKDEVKVVDDFDSCPTYAEDLAEGVTEQFLNGEQAPGIYHLTNEGHCTRYEFAKKLFELLGYDIDVIPVDANYFPAPAKRPHSSILINTKLKTLRSWEEALRVYIDLNYKK